MTSHAHGQCPAETDNLVIGPKAASNLNSQNEEGWLTIINALPLPSGNDAQYS